MADYGLSRLSQRVLCSTRFDLTKPRARIVVSSGVAAGAYNLLKTWIDTKNGRKLKLKVGEIEVEATQMPEKDVLRLLDLLQHRADEKKIRDLLLQSSTPSTQSNKG